MTQSKSAVYIFDDLNPEDNAMVQALYSRSPASVIDHRKKVEEVGSGNFVSQYYVGYGHASIGDCGSTTIYIENVSMLVAKAIQDHPLYSGQEASTRYLDFSTQPQYDPYGTPESKAILEKWLSLYNQYMPLAIEGLKQRYPFNADTDRSEKIWCKTIEVRAFDILRSLLPIGTTTLLSWHTNLRQARDHLRELVNHPLEEVRKVALEIYQALMEKYPNSFEKDIISTSSDYHIARMGYSEENSIANNYITPHEVFSALDHDAIEHVFSGAVAVQSYVNTAAVNKEISALDRPKGSLLPRRLIQYGVYNFRFLLDFGSFRDLQRQRNGYCPVPLIDATFGFYSGYDNELCYILSDADYAALKGDIDQQLTTIENFCVEGSEDEDVLRNQYLYPMGITCACMVSYSLPQSVYVSELRSGKTVHFTLRPIAQAMGDALQQAHPDLKLYVDYDQDSFTTKRGEQDITAKPAP